MLVMQPLNLRWISNAADDRAECCAHGDVVFRIGDDVLPDGTNGRDLTVSAAALYLCGCFRGENFEVLHQPDGSGVVLRAG